MVVMRWVGRQTCQGAKGAFQLNGMMVGRNLAKEARRREHLRPFWCRFSTVVHQNTCRLGYSEAD